MEISDKKLDEFKELYHKHFDKELSDKEAKTKARNLVRLMRGVYQPVRKSDAKSLLRKINN